MTIIAEVLVHKLTKGSSGGDTDDAGRANVRYFLKYTTYFIVQIILGACIFMGLEGWTFSEACYFCFVSITTVGFGDFFPTQAGAKMFCLFYVLLNIGFVAYFLNYVAVFLFAHRPYNPDRYTAQSDEVVDENGINLEMKGLKNVAGKVLAVS